MKILLKKEYRDKIAADYDLRIKISADIKSHERTIQRWAINNNPKIAAESVLNSLKKHTGLKISNDLLVDKVAVDFNHLHVA